MSGRAAMLLPSRYRRSKTMNTRSSVRPSSIAALKAAERGHATGSECAQFAVEVGRLRRQRTKRFDCARIATRPVEARAGQQLDLPTIHAGVHAAAVVLDLVQPIVAGRPPVA